MNKYNTFWNRSFALIIDGIILQIFDKSLNLIPLPKLYWVIVVMSIVSSNIPYLYTILMTGKYGQTLGKMIFKVKVVDNQTEKNIGYNKSFVREAIPLFLVNVSFIVTYIVFGDVKQEDFELSVIGYIILFIPSGMIFIWSIAEIITMLFNDKRRALHDLIAGTVVIKTDVKK